MNVKCIRGIFLTNTEWRTSVLVLKIPGFDSVCPVLHVLKLLIEQVILEKCIITLGLHTFMLYGLKIGHYFTYLIVWITFKQESYMNTQ